MNNLKTSSLIPSQVPEFVREEYPKFVSFLKAYYEFLETSENNSDLTNKSKSLREVYDIDSSLDEFENNFYEKFAALLPKETAVRKDILFKNLNLLYRSKGTTESYKFLFRMLFNEELEIIEPKNEVLKTSASVWSVENSVRADPDSLYQKFTGNGTKTTFILPSKSFTVKQVFVNGSPVTNYLINKEYKKIIFDTAPTNGSVIKIYFNNFDFDLLINRKVSGITSNASGIIEKVAIGLVTNTNVEDLFINSKTLIGNFENGEYCSVDIIDEDGNILYFEFLTSSALKAINVIDGGSNYTSGEFVLISGGSSEQEAVAIVDEVFTGAIDIIEVSKPGAGFASGGLIETINPRYLVNGAIQTVDTTTINVTNTYVVYSDTIISNLSALAINTGDYGIPSKSINKDSKIYEMFNPRTYTVGGIATCLVSPLSSNVIATFIPTLETEPLVYTTSNVSGSSLSFQNIGRFQSLGGYIINDGGSDYHIGDEIVFGVNPSGTYGTGAAARVSSVNSDGSILKINFEPVRVAGNVSVTTNSSIVTGVGTDFNRDLFVGDQIIVNGEIKLVDSIDSGTQITCNSDFLYSTSSITAKLGVYNRYPIGGILYKQNNFPSITVQSINGTGANVELNSLMGDGENLVATSTRKPGSIVRIRIIDGGKGYKYIPFINLTQSGDGKATAVAEIDSSFVTFEGKWTSSDSIISSTERKIQGRDYYVDYAYLLSSKVEFRKYKKIIKQLLHPSGLIDYARFKVDTTANVSSVDVISLDTAKTISGKVNVESGKIYITGSGTNFINAYQKGLIKLGDAVDVNGSIFIVDQIVSSTNIKVEPIVSNSLYPTANVPFDYTSNSNFMVVIGQLKAGNTWLATSTATLTMEDGTNLCMETDSNSLLTTD